MHRPSSFHVRASPIQTTFVGDCAHLISAACLPADFRLQGTVPSTSHGLIAAHWRVAAFSMEFHAVLVMVNVSKPWSEDDVDMPWDTWWANSMGRQSTLPVGTYGQQQDEWVSALSSRAGVVATLKPLGALSDAARALNTTQPHGGGIVKVVLRPIVQQHGCADFPMRAAAEKKSYYGIYPVSYPLRVQPVQRDDRERSHPNTMAALFANDTEFMSIRDEVHAFLEPLIEAQRHQDYMTRVALETAMRVFDKACRALQEPATAQPALPRSTEWLPTRGRRLIRPQDVVDGNCCCVTAEKFPMWLHRDCGQGIFHVTGSTVFDSGPQMVATIQHSLKFQVLSLCRTCPVAPTAILRGVISQDDMDTLRVAGAAETTHSDWEAWDSTDKHKVLWLIQTRVLLQHAGGKGLGKGKGTDKGKSTGKGLGQGTGKNNGTNMGKGKGTESLDETLLQYLWAAGSLHLAVSAPRTSGGRWKIRFAPDAPPEFAGEVTCFVLDWVGNHAFYHECMRRVSTQQHPFGPLCARLLAPSHNMLNGNVMNGKVANFAHLVMDFNRCCHCKWASAHKRWVL